MASMSHLWVSLMEFPFLRLQEEYCLSWFIPRVVGMVWSPTDLAHTSRHSCKQIEPFYDFFTKPCYTCMSAHWLSRIPSSEKHPWTIRPRHFFSQLIRFHCFTFYMSITANIMCYQHYDTCETVMQGQLFDVSDMAIGWMKFGLKTPSLNP